MTVLNTAASLQSALVPGKKYRFHARSAEEAVQIIHERMGPKARVVAVEQVGGQGLSRLLRSPKLEVVAMIPEEKPETPAEAAPRPAQTYTASTARPAEARPDFPAPLVEEEERLEEAPLRGGRDLRAILKRLGFSAELLGQFASSVRPQELARQGWTGKLDRFIEFLWGRYNELPTVPLTGQVAFLGTPGTGITTALCKELTASVFLRNEQPLVACLETDQTNSTEGLRAFCELMQVPLVSESRAAMTPSERVFWDVPGISSRDFDTWRQVGGRLDDLGIGTRVLVVHAAFDSQSLLHLRRTLDSVQPTHVVVSHLDDAFQPARLWDFLLSCGLTPLFVSENASVTGGRRDDFHAALLAQTFPAQLSHKA